MKSIFTCAAEEEKKVSGLSRVSIDLLNIPFINRRLFKRRFFPNRERARTAGTFVDSCAREERSPWDRWQSCIRRCCRHSRESMVPFVRELGESGWPLRPLDQWPALDSRSILRGTWFHFKKWKKEISFDRFQTIDHTIPSGGDIVVGQEYTDFDKGLDDGIEGSILGFNLLLASAFDDYHHLASHDSIQVSRAGYATVPLFARIPTKLMQRGIDYKTRTRTTSDQRYAEDAPLVAAAPTRFLFSPIQGRMEVAKKQSLGLRLVKLSYARCEIGRGSPFIGGTLMLISWTRTPVRIFGGAVLKNVNSECGNFSIVWESRRKSPRGDAKDTLLCEPPATLIRIFLN